MYGPTRQNLGSVIAEWIRVSVVQVDDQGNQILVIEKSFFSVVRVNDYR